MAMKKRNIARIVVAVIVLVWAGWNYLPSHSGKHAAKPVAPAVAASVAPAPPATWTLSKVTLHRCAIGGGEHGDHGPSVAAWCAWFPVPEDRAHPGGRHIKLHLAIVRSASENTDPDLVAMLAGGPGEAASHFARVAALFPRLHRHHDFLLLDQRGTGQSNALTCKNVPTAQPAVASSTRVRQRITACLKQVRRHADPRFYTTTAAVADLEAVREALGSPRLDLIGVSYGTRVALQYLRAHPEGVRTVVLDSPVPNRVVLGQDFARNLQSALKKDFALCTHEPACHKRFGDPMHTLQLLRHALAANPHSVSARNPWTFAPQKMTLDAATLASVVHLFAYSHRTIQLLPLTIDAAAHGDVGPLLGQYAQLQAGQSGKHVARGMNASVICSEDADLLHPSQAAADTLLGNRIIQHYQTICAVWPHGKRPADFHQPVTSNKPVLILSGALDPVTPPAYGKMIAQHLSDARQIIVKGQAHGLITLPCARGVIGQFIRRGNPDKLQTACLKGLPPPTPFLNFNGEAP